MMDWDNIHPKARGPFMRLEEELLRMYMAGSIPYWFRAFEGYRSPLNQNNAFERGASKAKAWQSAHQYGLAVDFVPYVQPGDGAATAKPQPHPHQGRWAWDVPAAAWDLFDRAVTQSGLLRPIPWDRPHVEHTLWREIKGRML